MAPLLAVALTTLTACGGTEESGATSETVAPTATTSTAASIVVSTDATCEQLMGSGSNGPIFEGVDFVMTLTSHEGVEPDDIASARTVADRLRPIVDRSGEELKPYLEAFIEPAETLVEAADGNGQYEQNFDNWQASSTELLTRCGGKADSSATEENSDQTLVVSEAATCMQLVGPDEDGPLIRGVDAVTSVTDGNPDVELAEEVLAELESVIEHSNEDLRPYINAFAAPIEAIVSASNGELPSDWEADIDEWQAAGTELLTRCQ